MASKKLRQDRESLERYFQEVNTIILSRQNPATGLIPASVAVTTHGDYRDAWVRDNVYSIFAVWGLGLAYRRLDDDSGRAYELEFSTIKCMRGLLYAMMRQASKVEKFKNTQAIQDALHAKYNTATGATVVGDTEWGHLQIDATSLFLLALAQMTVSGLHIVYTLDEVAFVQNLTFYIERAYRTPDYGVWERGNKSNHGQPELNCSSIGMALAALQAINGINLFGSRGGASSVIHVLPDEITRNFTTLHSALPRESASKEIDAALLSVISFPAFAVADKDLIDKTRNEIIKKLGGKYGCKRFLRDGHQTVLEDSSRLHYNPHELKIFEGIESEWPLFFTYLILDGIFRNDKSQVEKYRDLLDPLLVDSSTIEMYNREKQMDSEDWGDRRRKMSISRHLPPDHMRLIPELYIVPLELVDAEKKKPMSQDRVPGANVPLVWAQSLSILGNLMYDNLLTPSDIDPLGRRLLPYSRGKHIDPVVQVVLLSDSVELQTRLRMFGLETQTRENCSPVTVSQPSCLRDAMLLLGENKKLGLSGRPARPIGTLSTSKLYRCQGELYAFQPHFLDREEFYLVSDPDYLVTLFEQELAFIKNHWLSIGRPTMVVCLTKQMLGGLTQKPDMEQDDEEKWKSNVSSSKRNLLNFMMSLRTGVCNGVRVRLGRLSEMINTACIESLDFLVQSDNADTEDWLSILGRSDPENEKRLQLGSDRRESHHGKSPSRGASVKKFSLSETSIAAAGSMSPLTSPVFTDDPEEEPLLTFSKKVRGVSPIRASRVQKDAESSRGTPVQSTMIHTSSKPSPLGPISAVTSEPDNLLTLILGDESNIDAAIDLLRVTDNLYDQIDVLHYILSCRSMTFEIDGFGYVNGLIEEVYEQAMHYKQWSIVRQAAGLLKKNVNSLTSNLSDLLIRQKPCTVGFGNLEFFIDSPMNPKALYEIIHLHCASDIREAPLVQEVMTYLGSAIRANPTVFNGMMRIRTHFFIIAMREEVSRIKGCDEQEAIEHLMQLSPSEMKSLLNLVLTAGQQLDQGLDDPVLALSTDVKLKHTKLNDTTSTKEHPSCFPMHLPDVLTVTAQSGGFDAGNMAKIEIHHDDHDHPVSVVFGRGLNVVVIDQMEGRIMQTKHYDTNLSPEASEEFASMIAKLDPQTIVILAVKDDCSVHLTESAKLALERLGANSARAIRYRDSYCLIGEKGASAVEYHQNAQFGPTPTITRTFDLLSRRRDFLIATTGVKPTGPLSVASIMPSQGRWLRRRKNDGALNRTPLQFYPKVWKLLSKCGGISIGKKFLPRDPTISEKTPEEFNFALQVEALLDAVRDPAERQIVVETLVAIYRVAERNPEVKVSDDKLDILSIVNASVKLFWTKWITAQRGIPIEASKNGKPLASDPVVIEALKELQKVEPVNNTSPLIANLERTIEETPSSSSGSDYTFEKNERLARRLFFDLPQEGDEGTMSYLGQACSTIFTVKWQA